MVLVSDKSLLVIIFMYGISFGVLIAQAVYADPYGIVLKGSDGKPIQDVFVKISNVNTLIKEQKNINVINSTNIQSNPLGVASAISEIAVQLVEIAAGVYIFDILLHLGVPSIAIAAMVGIYIILLGRAVLGWIRGVF